MSGDILEPGDVIGDKYEIEQPIGRGGFSHVYRGVHRAMERVVAIKIFDPRSHGGDTPDRTAWRAERFEREARLVSGLEHPNTVTIFDFGLEDDDRAYLVMEYIDGQTLDGIIRQQGPLDPQRTVAIFLQVLKSLEEAHHREILHRDLKPANIMLTENFKGEEIAKVLDFGIARLLRDRRDRTSNDDKQLFLGTPRYAAPEQLTMKPLSLATDIYCVGALLWESVVGRPMVSTSEVRECIRLAIDSQPWRLPGDADVGPELRSVIETSVSKDPSRRYQNAAEMMNALEECSSVVRSELPDIQNDSPFFGSDSVVDPNVDDPQMIGPDDERAYFPNPDGSSPPPLPNSSTDPDHHEPSPANQSRRDSKTPSQPAPGPSSDKPRPTPPKRPSSSPSTSPPGEPADSPHELTLDKPSTARRSAPSTAAAISSGPAGGDTGSSDTRRLALFASIGAVAAVFAVGALWMTGVGDDAEPVDDEPPNSQVSTQDSPGETNAESTDVVAFDDDLFTIESVLLAVRTYDWETVFMDEVTEHADYTYQPLSVSDGHDRLDLHVYKAERPEIVAELSAETSSPGRDISMGPIVVRIEPSGREFGYTAHSLYNDLQEFRDLVLEEAGY